MIKITVELISAINAKNSRILGIAEIYNDWETSHKSNGKKGSYTIKLSKWAPKLNQTWKSGTVKNFDRVKRGPWDLLYLGLKNIVGDRNKNGS